MSISSGGTVRILFGAHTGSFGDIEAHATKNHFGLDWQYVRVKLRATGAVMDFLRGSVAPLPR